MGTIRSVALTDGELPLLIEQQSDPVKKDQLVRSVVVHPRRSGDKLYVDQRLIDGLRLPWSHGPGPGEPPIGPVHLEDK